MEKLNIAELLKDCPKGMELDCINYDGIVTLEEITDCSSYPIKISIKYGNESFTHTLTKYGQTCKTLYNKCVIFPKGKTTWEGFKRPFKDGDILAYDNKFAPSTIFIYRYDNPSWNTSYFVGLSGLQRKFYKDATGALDAYNPNVRFATEEEKQKLFDTIKTNGYKWNPETKTLEKLIEPKFEVGDRITNGKVSIIISHIDDNYYYEVGKNIANRLSIKNQDDWRLDKFDITTLKPFSKVLVRCNSLERWHIQFFEKYNRELDAKYPFICLCNNKYSQCIPYEGNEHLLGTTNDCDEYYKTWE